MSKYSKVNGIDYPKFLSHFNALYILIMDTNLYIGTCYGEVEGLSTIKSYDTLIANGYTMPDQKEIIRIIGYAD